MHKPLSPLSALLFPVCGLGLLAVGSRFTPKLLPPSVPASEISQRNPAWANPRRLIILRRQYRFYRQCRLRLNGEARAVAEYNQCVADSDPSVLNGTSLPHHLP